ncbi:MAG: TraB/GumN family protein [Rudaea sp.]
MHLIRILLLSLVSALASAQAPSPAAAQAELPVAAPTLDTVLVTGEQPGPGLWKVTRGDHVLWILGTQQPLPRDFTWRATEVEKIIAQSQAVLSDADVGLHVGFFRSIFLLPSVLGAKKNGDGKTLREVLTPELYARWLALKEKYIGRDRGVERLRPMLAANELYKKAIKKSGLTTNNLAQDVVDFYAKKNKVPVETPHVKLEIEDPKQAIADFKSTAGSLDVACLERTMARLENDLGAMRARANAWAIGDLDALKNLPYPDQRAACIAAVSSNPRLAEQLKQARQRVDGEWIAAADVALARNASTLAVLPIAELLRPEGRLAQLRAKGYAIEDPQ